MIAEPSSAYQAIGRAADPFHAPNLHANAQRDKIERLRKFAAAPVLMLLHPRCSSSNRTFYPVVCLNHETHFNLPFRAFLLSRWRSQQRIPFQQSVFNDRSQDIPPLPYGVTPPHLSHFESMRSLPSPGSITLLQIDNWPSQQASSSQTAVTFCTNIIFSRPRHKSKSELNYRSRLTPRCFIM